MVFSKNVAPLGDWCNADSVSALLDEVGVARNELKRAEEAFGEMPGKTLAESIAIRQAAWRKEHNRLGVVISGLRDDLAAAKR